MKLALVNGQRQEAQPNLSGKCPACDHPMVAKCGEVKIWHWAHQGRRFCDAWWENETEWHRGWKGQFPVDWQEIVHYAEDRERHIADVKTDRGWILEFQHSYITPEERRSREAFYPKLVWVVDGTRRKRDRNQFVKAFEGGTPVGRNSLVRRTISDECLLLREWSGSPAPVFLDFGDEQILGWLVGKSPNGPVYVARFPRAVFLEIHRGTVTQDFDSLVKELSELAAMYESHRQAQGSIRYDPLQSFRRYPARRRRL